MPMLSAKERHALYLQCDCWRKVTRMIALASADYVCRCCHRAPATQVHHKHYRTIGNERPGDLVAVCAACHCALHNIVWPIQKAANDNQLSLFDVTPKPMESANDNKTVNKAQRLLDLFGEAS